MIFIAKPSARVGEGENRLGIARDNVTGLGRGLNFLASVFQLAGGSEDPPVFDITRPRRADGDTAEFVRVPLNFSAPEPAPTAAHGGPAALCSPRSLRVCLRSEPLRQTTRTTGQQQCAKGTLVLQCTSIRPHKAAQLFPQCALRGSRCSHSFKDRGGTMRRRWLGLSCAALVAERAAPLNPLRRLLRRPPPVSDARCLGLCGIKLRASHAIDATFSL